MEEMEAETSHEGKCPRLGEEILAIYIWQSTPLTEIPQSMHSDHPTQQWEVNYLLLFHLTRTLRSQSYNKNKGSLRIKRFFSINPFVPRSSRIKKILLEFEFDISKIRSLSYNKNKGSLKIKYFFSINPLSSFFESQKNLFRIWIWQI